ncbi:MAG TPA: hypothetical protein VGF73_05320 [Chthoniobacterales bacterium]|jgi:hypothetical protein
MKKTFLSILLATVTSVAWGQGQGELSTTTSTTTNATGQIQTQTAKPRPPSAARLVPIEGVVQAAIRHGNFVQMVNPAAPASYGSGQEHASHDPNNPGKPKGIVLFAWTF